MSDAAFYIDMVHLMMDCGMPSAFVVVDANSKTISEIFMTKHSKRRLRHLVGMDFSRLLRMLFVKESAETIYCSYTQAVENFAEVDIPKTLHEDLRGMQFYFSTKVRPVLEKGVVLVYLRDITEETLIAEEFSCMSQEYESMNRELCVAMSKQDFYLMDIEQAHKKVAALYRISSIVQKTVNEQEVLEGILDGITREFGFSDLSIMFLDEANQKLIMQAYRGRYARDTEISIDNGFTGYAIQKRELIYVDKIPSHLPDIESDPTNFSGEVAVPLIANDTVLGVLTVGTSGERVLQSYDLDVFRSLASNIAMTIAHAKHVAKVEVQAITDGLTGLYNYRYFRAILEQEFKRVVRYNRSLSLLMIDIDYFKHYNDANGHLMGDAALKTVADLLRASCRDIDFIVRYGGEEFAVLLPETNVKDAYLIAERIRASIAEYPFPNCQAQPNGALTVSIGIAEYPADADNDIDLIERADAALYQSKRCARNRISLYGQLELQSC